MPTVANLRATTTDVPLVELLVPRNETPAEAALLSGELPVIAKIGFGDGRIEFRDETTTNTDMIIVQPGDLVISGINAHQGAIALYDGEAPAAATIHYSSYAVRDDRVAPRLLWYLLRSAVFKERLNRALPGGIKTELTPERLLSITVPLPEASSQPLLLERLSALVSKVERVRELRAATTVALPRIMLAALEDVFGRFTETRRWEEVIAFKPRSGPSFRTDPEWNGTPVLMPSAVTGFGVDIERVEYGVGDEMFSAKDQLEPGDIIIARGNKADQVGNAGVVPEEARGWVAANLLMRLQVDPRRADARFCIYWLRSPRMRELVKRAMKGTNPNIQKINQRVILAFPFPADVGVDEQREMVSYLDSIQAKVDRIKSLQAETATEVKMLSPAILATAFAGGL
jgi:type I restriction enzyme, S subunit